jgi:branched-chain amino acid transport system substrate-binding protein
MFQVRSLRGWLTVVFAAAAPTAASAQQITVGVSVGSTGQTASIGIPMKQGAEVLPQKFGNVSVRYIFLDDGGDPGVAVKNMRQLIEQDHADIVLGSSSIPSCTAMAEVAVQTQTPQICLTTVRTNAFTFATAQPADLMVQGMVAHMHAKGFKNIGYIGFADSLGEHNLSAMQKRIEPLGMKLVASERYNRTDTSVTAQILKIMATRPDAIFVSASGTPAALPQIELAQRGYKGQVYFLHGVINRDFLRVGGKSLEGVIATAGPFAVAGELPDSNPIKREALTFTKIYNDKFGANSVNTFAAYSWDAGKVLEAAVPVAIAKAQPGTAEFRVALRDALQQNPDIVGANGVYKMSPTDHNGLDSRARVMVTVRDGAFHPLP